MMKSVLVSFQHFHLSTRALDAKHLILALPTNEF